MEEEECCEEDYVNKAECQSEEVDKQDRQYRWRIKCWIFNQLEFRYNGEI